MKNYHIAIDPGTTKCGWCVMYDDGDEVSYVESGCIRVRGARVKLPWYERSDWVIGEILNEASRHNCQGMAIIELPSTQFQSEKGEAARNSEASVKLYGMTIALRYAFIAAGIVEDVRLTPVSEWKGQVPKTVTQQRLSRHWGFCPEQEDEADAMAIADWYLRRHSGLMISK